MISGLVQYKIRLNYISLLSTYTNMELGKPGELTTSGRSKYNYHRWFNNKHLILAKDGQFFPAWGGQGHWLFHFSYFLNKHAFFYPPSAQVLHFGEKYPKVSFVKVKYYQ